MIVSRILIRFADLERYRGSPFGQYTARYMNRAAQATRLIGYAVAAVGAGTHVLVLVPIGIAVIWGLFFMGRSRTGNARK